MCFNHGQPGPGATKIAGLKPGDQIRLQADFGDPASEDERILFVIDVDGFSALCDDGTTLAGCREDGYGFEVIGHKPVEEVTISEIAQEALRQAVLRRAQRDADWAADLREDLL